MLRTIFLGFNGIAEALAYSRAQSQSRLRSSMLVTSLVYAAALFYFCREYGVRGLFYANALQMALRGSLSLTVSHGGALGLLS